MTDHIEHTQEPAQLPDPVLPPVYESVQNENFRPKFAGFWTRFWAYLIDLLIVSAISGIIIKPLFRIIDIPISNPGFLLFSPYKVVLLILFLSYFAVMTKIFSQTVGKMILGIKVVSTNGSRLTWGNILFREVIGRFISKLLTIPYLLVIFMPKKEAVHDLFADTHVIHEQTFEREVVTYKRELKSDELQGGTIV